MQWLEDPAPDLVDAMLAQVRQLVARQLVTGYLERAGLRILDHGWKCSDGVIDVVATEGPALVVCQVTDRRCRRLHPRRPLARASARKLRRLGVRWLAAKGGLFDELRVDLVTLTPESAGGFAVEHVRGAA